MFTRFFGILLFIVCVIAGFRLSMDSRGSVRQVSLASQAAICATPEERESAISLLNEIFENYGGPRQYSMRTAMREVINCLGKVGTEIELLRIAKARGVRLKDARRSKSLGRYPAQATTKQVQTYQTWAVHSQGVKTVSEVTRGVGWSVLGFSVAVSPFVGPEFIPPGYAVKKGFDVAASVIDVVGNGLEKVATYYSADLFSGKYDSDAIRIKMENAKAPEEKRQAVLTELKTKAASTVDFQKLLPTEREKAMERAVDNSIRYAADLKMEMDANKVETQNLGKAVGDLAGKQDSLRKGFLAQNIKMEKKMEGLGNEIGKLRTDQKSQFRFLLDINADRMSAGQKKRAILDFQYGDFKTPEERDQRIAQLEMQESIENFQSGFDSGLQDIVGVKNILGNLGIQSKELNNIVDLGQKGSKAISAVGMLASGNYIGGIMSMTSIFGGGGMDPGAAMHAQVMEALGTIISLQKKTIELQVKTMEMIQELAKSLDIRLNIIDHTVGQVLRLQSFAWINTYYEKLILPMAQCREYKVAWRENFLRNGMSARAFRSSPLAETVEGGKTLMSTLVERDEKFNVMSLSEWQRTPFDVEKFRVCHEELTKIKTQLLEPFRDGNAVTGGKLSVNPLFTTEGMTIARDGADQVRALMDEQQVLVSSLKAFLSALVEQDPDMYDRVIMAALSPSFEGRDFVQKLNAIHGPDAEKLLATFRKDLGSRLQFFRALASRDSSVFINPHFLTTFIRNWQDAENISPLLKGKAGFSRPDLRKPFSTLDQAELESGVMITNLVIVQQALLNGDGLLAAIDKYWSVPKEAVQPSAAQSTISDAGVQTIGRLAYNILATNRVVLHNYIRYKAASVYGDSPYVGYALQLEKLAQLKSPFYFNVRLAQSELSVTNYPKEEKGEPEWYLSLNPVVGRLQDQAVSRTVFSDGSSVVKMSFAETSPEQRANVDSLRIALPTSEEFFEDRLVMPSVLINLYEAKAALLVEQYHHVHLPTGQANLAESDRVVLEEMREEVKNAGL